MKEKPLIFVVDDDAIIRNNLQRYLTRNNWEVKTIADGFEVLLLCLYLKPDLIISDIRMPKLDGITLLKGLRSNPETREIPVIFMSAYATDEIMDEARKFGAEFFLPKPFTLEYLQGVVYRALPHLFEYQPQPE